MTPRLGLVGGLGPESTIDYYRRILAAAAEAGLPSAPSLVIDSLDVPTGLRLAGTDHPGLVEYLLESIHRLAGAGADFVAMAANTAHVVLDDLAPRSPIPILSIVDACADEAERLGLRRLALLGTRFTMEGAFYPATFARRGMSTIPPAAGEIAWLHDRYVAELLKGEFRDETRHGLMAMVGRLRREQEVDGVILGGTELPLLLRTPTIEGLPMLDTTALHVAAIVRRLCKLDS